MEPSIKAKIHPVVLLSIIDAYERKNFECERVIGTLLGTFDKGVVEVTSCFAVTYKSNGKEPGIDFDASVSMLKYEKESSDDLTYLYELTTRLLTMLSKVIDYTEAIVNETSPADSNLGRAIAQLIFSIPKLDPEQIDSLINSSYKDLVMITYLTNLVRTHLKLLNLAG